MCGNKLVASPETTSIGMDSMIRLFGFGQHHWHKTANTGSLPITRESEANPQCSHKFCRVALIIARLFVVYLGHLSPGRMVCHI